MERKSVSGGSGSAVPRREPVPFSGTVQRRPGCSSLAARMIAVTAVLSLLAETAAAAPSQPSSRTQQASAIREKGMLTVQQLSTSNSNVRVRLDGGQLSLAGRLVNYTGRLDRRPSLEDSAVTVAFDLSSIQSDPGSGSVYLNPDVLFRSIPDPRIHFQSTRITKKGGNQYTIEGKAKRGVKEYPVTLSATVGRSDALFTECTISMQGNLAQMQAGGPIPGGFGSGSVEARLVFKTDAVATPPLKAPHTPQAPDRAPPGGRR